MNRVTKRAWIMVVFIVLLAGGMAFFLGEYAMESQTWVLSAGSPHLYNNSKNLGCGLVTDREGIRLLDTRQERTYCEDASIRRATLHWLGDKDGYISATAISNYAGELSGFDRVNGIYSYAGTGGQAELTISGRIQAAALEAMGDRKGTIGIYNYKTGEILCAVTTPTFDPEDPPNIQSDPGGAYEGIYLNRFIQSAYVPGSIFKIVTTAAALETVEGIGDMQFSCTGVYEFGVDRVTCERVHGTLDLKGAMAASCNCAFAQIAQLIGRENMTDYVNMLGVADSVSFDGVTTVKGNYDVSDAAAVELAWSCIGQYTDLINPCAYMTFLGAVAGGGTGAQPYLVSRITVEDEVTYQAQTAYTQTRLSAETAQTLTEYMRNNVLCVYGDQNFPGMTVCAKSGTSQLGGDKISNAMFAGFVADEEYPLAFIVVIENGGYGSATCIPALSKVLAVCKTVLDEEMDVVHDAQNSANHGQ